MSFKARLKPRLLNMPPQRCAKEHLEAGYQELIDERLEAFKNGNLTKLSDIAASRQPYVAPDITKVLEGRSYSIGK